MSRGGRRTGGGRKPIPPEQRRVVLSCRVKPETFDAICREAGQGSIGRLLDKIFNSEIPNDRPLPEDTVLFNKGVEEGKRLMMEDAEEYKVGMHGEPINITLDKYVQRARGIFPGDKVRIIIVKD